MHLYKRTDNSTLDLLATWQITSSFQSFKIIEFNMTATLTEPCEPVQGLVSPYSLDLTINDAGDIGDRLRPLLSQLEAELGYAGATSSHGLDDLLQGMHEHADHIGVAYPEGSVSWKAFRVGLMYAHVSIYATCLLGRDQICLA